jgi:hypothetical protein
MAESHKFKDLNDATAVWPDLPWMRRGDGQIFVFDAKQDTYVTVDPGQYIVSIGDRFEVADNEPEKANTVETPKDEPKKETQTKKSEDSE